MSGGSGGELERRRGGGELKPGLGLVVPGLSSGLKYDSMSRVLELDKIWEPGLELVSRLKYELMGRVPVR